MPTIQIQLALTVDEGTVHGIAEALGRVLKQAIATLNSDEDERREGRLQISRKASHAERYPPSDEMRFIGTREVAKLLGVSECMLWKMRRDRTIVPPVKIGNAVRWNVERLKKWIDRGCQPPKT